jgi:hypothetical protein
MRIVIGFALCRIWIQCLQDMLDAHNPYIQNFRQIRDILLTNDVADIWYIYCDPAIITLLLLLMSRQLWYLSSNRDIVFTVNCVMIVYKEYCIFHMTRFNMHCCFQNGSTVKVRGRIHLDNRWVSFSRSSEALNKKTCWLGECYECYQKRSIIECLHRF